MVPLAELQPRRIALIKPSALGDIVHALPVLSALRDKFPQSEITWVVNKSFEPLLTGHPDLTDTLPFDRGASKRGPFGAIHYALRLASELRKRRFDLVVDLQGLLRSGLMGLATGSPRIVGFANAREGSRFAYTDRVRIPNADRIHAVDRYWRIVEALGAGERAKRFHVPISKEARTWATVELRGLPRPIIAVAVGAKWMTKRWPPEHFAKLLRRVSGSCIFVGSADDTALSQEVIREISPTQRDFTGQTTLPQLAALLAAADIMIGNDTGPLHLAAALGKPCVAPYTCTRIARHGPYGSLGGAVETSVPCAGSYIKTCPKMICMTELSPERLEPRLAEVLETWARNSRSA
ncbi:MAG TPA: glycosyltransferase family 9 protein [Urbifossiella sp.]|jgi:lipopolysaccharide heptosyltransferase I